MKTAAANSVRTLTMGSVILSGLVTSLAIASGSPSPPLTPYTPTTSVRAARDAGRVARRVKDCQPTEFEKRWQTIGWADSILHAERLAKERKRPVFLFTHDGRLNVGRC